LLSFTLFPCIFALTFDLCPHRSKSSRCLFRTTFTFYQATLPTHLDSSIPSAYLFARYNFRATILRALIAVRSFSQQSLASFNAIFVNGLASDLIDSPLSLILALSSQYHYRYPHVGNAFPASTPGLSNRLFSRRGLVPRLVEVILPIIRPSILASSLLVFLFDFTSFGVILLLGGSQFATLEVEIYFQSVKYLNLHLAAFLSVIQLFCTLVISILYTRYVTRNTQQLDPRSAQSNLRQP
jgi:thiamine transport system permease protein